MSLFQGAMSIHINNSAQDRLEEQEEIEDQKRRHKEVCQQFFVYFTFPSKLFFSFNYEISIEEKKIYQ